MESFRVWRTRDAYCQLEIAETFFPASGGWATNRDSPCVQAAIEYGLKDLANTGQIACCRRSWPRVGCAASSGGESGGREVVGVPKIGVMDLLGMFIIGAPFRWSSTGRTCIPASPARARQR